MAKSLPPTQTEPLVLSVKDCVRLTTLGRTKLYEALASGELPSLRVGRRRLIRMTALHTWLAGLEQQAG
jgi:excisionase family DNA binding protein